MLRFEDSNESASRFVGTVLEHASKHGVGLDTDREIFDKRMFDPKRKVESNLFARLSRF